MVTALIVYCLWFGCPDPEPVSVVGSQPIIVEVGSTGVVEEVEPEPPAQKVEISANRGMGNRTSDVEQWRPLVAGHFEPEDVERALCLIGFESGGNPDARNGSSGASGLLQVMPFWADEYGVSRGDLFTPEINLWIARKIRDSQGWGAWSPYNRGECR